MIRYSTKIERWRQMTGRSRLARLDHYRWQVELGTAGLRGRSVAVAADTEVDRMDHAGVAGHVGLGGLDIHSRTVAAGAASQRVGSFSAVRVQVV